MKTPLGRLFPLLIFLIFNGPLSAQESWDKDFFRFKTNTGRTLLALMQNAIEKNDRNFMADLMEKQKPAFRDVTESIYWDKIIESYRNPLPPERKKIVFRGIAKKKFGEQVYNFNDPQKLFNISNYLKPHVNEELEPDSSKRCEKYSDLSDIFEYHAFSAHSSSLISMSSSYPKSRTFTKNSEGEVAVFLVDPRTSFNNFSSPHREFEVLVPLVTFPDEFVGFIPKEKSKVGDQPYELLPWTLEEKILLSVLAGKYGMEKAKAILHGQSLPVIYETKADDSKFKFLGKATYDDMINRNRKDSPSPSSYPYGIPLTFPF